MARALLSANEQTEGAPAETGRTAGKADSLPPNGAHRPETVGISTGQDPLPMAQGITWRPTPVVAPSAPELPLDPTPSPTDTSGPPRTQAPASPSHPLLHTAGVGDTASASPPESPGVDSPPAPEARETPQQAQPAADASEARGRAQRSRQVSPRLLDPVLARDLTPRSASPETPVKPERPTGEAPLVVEPGRPQAPTREDALPGWDGRISPEAPEEGGSGQSRARDGDVTQRHPSLPAQESRPLRAQEARPLPAQESRPLPAQESRPLPAHEARPLPAQESRPLPAHEARPLPAHEARPQPAHEAQPLPAHGAQPLPAHGAQPQPAISAPVGARDDAPGPAFRESFLLDQISDGVARARQLSRLVVELRPPDLGSLEIAVESRDGRLQAHFQATHPVVNSWLEENRADLRSHLSESGLVFEQFTFSSSSGRYHGGADSDGSTNPETGPSESGGEGPRLPTAALATSGIPAARLMDKFA